MPRPNPPPTPGSSSDLYGKEGAQAAPAFHLPPTAFQDIDRTSTSSATPSASGSDSSYRPASPSLPADQSRKKAAHQASPMVRRDDFALPPPPTRSRKIIQMKPRANDVSDQSQAGPSTSLKTGDKAQSAAPLGSKRKQNGATTAAGRKIARKTAHSLIERRRRSKMNEEFGVLKDMIPACRGQEMHKLAILQASIDYLQYLEQCVSDLQAQHNSPRQPLPTIARRMTEDEDDDEDEDQEMDDEVEDETVASTPVTTAQDRSGSILSLPSLSQITSQSTNSPSIFSSGAGRHYSISSASQPSFSPYFHSTQTSPAFGPQLSHVVTAPGATNANFRIGSPALKPLEQPSFFRQIADGATESPEQQRQRRPESARSEHELDQEATAALLMLNHDRRNWRAAQEPESGNLRVGTGMSVRELLSG